DVLFARRVIELFGPGPYKDVVIGNLAVVDLGARHFEVDGRDRRDVLHEEFRQPFGGDAVDWTHGDAIPVGVGEVLVDPDPAREVLVGQFARGEHDLAVFAVDHVAIVVHVHEVVVGPDLLELAIGGEQGPVVPKPHVL